MLRIGVLIGKNGGRRPPLPLPATRKSSRGEGKLAFVVGTILIDYIASMVSKAQRIILADHTRLPWRFFGRLTAVQAGL